MGEINRSTIFGIRPYLRGIMQNREAYDFGFRLAEHFNEPLRTKEEAEMDSILMKCSENLEIADGNQAESR